MGATKGYEVNELKFGADLNWAALSWLQPGVRFDRIQPNSNIREHSFAILSPRLTSRYFYARRECDPARPVDCVQPPPAPVLYEGYGSFPNGQDQGNRATMWW